MHQHVLYSCVHGCVHMMADRKAYWHSCFELVGRKLCVTRLPSVQRQVYIELFVAASSGL